MGQAHAFPAASAQPLAGVAAFDVFGQAEAFGLADIRFKADPSTGLRAIVAIRDRLMAIFERSRRRNIMPGHVGDATAELRLYGSRRQRWGHG